MREQRKIQSLFILLGVALTGCSLSNPSKQSAAPIQPGVFSRAEHEALIATPESKFTLIALTPSGKTASLAQMIRAGRGSVRVADEKTGILVAEVSGKEATKLESLNKGLGESAYASHIALDRVREYAPAFKSERLNPETGRDMNPNEVILDRRAENAQLPTHEMGVLAFEKQMQERFKIDVNGDSVKIAILDTGLDIAHKDVFQNRVIASWDVTAEGKTKLLPAAIDSSGGLSAIDPKTTQKYGPVKVPTSLLSPTNEYYLGSLSEKTYTGAGKSGDIDQDGNTDSVFSVLLVKRADGFRAVIDSNKNQDFGDDSVLRDYENSQDTVIMDRSGIGLVRLNVNIPVNSDGSLKATAEGSVELNIAGFDSGQHGTHVAGIAAGKFEGPQFAGQFRGGAPSAKLLGIKVLAKAGGADADIVEGIVLAVAKGADIINMSLGSIRRPTDGRDTLSLAIDQVARRSNTIFVISAGNSGPSMNSIGSPSTASRALSIGAYSSGETWKTAYNVKNAPVGHFVWSFSSRGPMETGEVRPTLLAPGAAYSSVPLARFPESSSGYDVFQGTSMAAPAATGAIASLIDAIHKLKGTKDLPSDSLSVARAVIDGAQDLNVLNKDNPSVPRYNRFDQGAGLLNVPNAFSALEKRTLEAAPEYVIKTDSLRDSYEEPAAGVYSTTRLPESIHFTIAKRAAEVPTMDEHNFDRHIHLISDAAWISPESDHIGINGLNASNVYLQVDQEALLALPYGAHSARIRGVNADNEQLEFVFDVTYVKTRELSQTTNKNEFVDPRLRTVPGDVKRYFFFISPDRSRFTVSLSIPEFDSEGKVTDGRYRLSIFDPAGRPVFEGAYVRGTNTRAEFAHLHPELGVWEFVIYRSFAATGDTPATLRFATEAVSAMPAVWNMAAFGTTISRSFKLTNYGRVVTPVAEAIGDRLAVVTKDVALTQKEKSRVQFTVPRGVESLVVHTEEVKSNLRADIDIRLFDGKGAVLGESGQANSEETIQAKVTPGDVLTLEIEAYDLAGQTNGLVDVEWDVTLKLPVKGDVTLPAAPLNWGKSTTMGVTLGLQSIEPTTLQDLKEAFSTVHLKGDVKIYDVKAMVERQISSVPIDIALP